MAPYSNEVLASLTMQNNFNYKLNILAFQNQFLLENFVFLQISVLLDFNLTVTVTAQSR